jgi:ferrous-iron efflux pump FieF
MSAAAESSSSERRARLLKLATHWSVATAAVLIVVKLVAWLETGAVSLLASLIDSLMDGAASVMNLVAVRFALRPADDEHRFGHGKAESLAALAQAAFIAGSALLLTFEAVDRLVNPRALTNPAAGLWVMVFATAATVVLLGVQRYVIRETGSLAIRADSLHYLTDLLTNLVTIAAIGLVMMGFERADALLALGIAAYILYSAGGIGFQAVNDLMDRELPADVQRRIVEVALEHPEVRGVHELRTRQSGPTRFIDLHLELNGRMSLAEAHRISDQVDVAIRSALPGADVMIHQDPWDDSRPGRPGRRRTSPPPARDQGDGPA